MSRYTQLFDQDNRAFVPFLMVGDPTPGAFQDIVDAAIEAGADALELGLPFSDPIADGPTVQRAHIRSAKAGTNTFNGLDQIAQVRERYPDLPIGLLMYSNVVDAIGQDEFYRRVADAGADSVLVADVPVREGEKFAEAALANCVDPIFIAPPNASEGTLKKVAEMSHGYVYAVSRKGVTGAEKASTALNLSSNVATLRKYNAPPSLLGFGISTPDHVRAAVHEGAAGAISGSAIVSIIEKNAENPAPALPQLHNFISQMKAATR